MSDLISGSELYDKLGNKLTWLMAYGDDIYLDVGSDIKDVIDNMPTAYDIDKVVEELDEYITKIVGRKSALYQTIMKIVKRGGKHDI